MNLTKLLIVPAVFVLLGSGCQTYRYITEYTATGSSEFPDTSSDGIYIAYREGENPGFMHRSMLMWCSLRDDNSLDCTNQLEAQKILDPAHNK